METISIEKHNEILRESIAIAISETKRLVGLSPMIEQPIGIDEASRFLGDMPKNTIYNLIHRSNLPHHRPAEMKRGRLFFYKSELNRWIKSGDCRSRRVKATERIDKLLAR